MASIRRWPTSSRSIGRSLPDAAGSRFLISASTSAPERLEIEAVAALARSASASAAPSRRTASAEAFPAAPSDSSAASLVSLLPFAAAATSASTAAGLFRSASARRTRAARPAGSLGSSATIAVSHFPGLTSRAVESPRRKTDCSGDWSCSTRSAAPSSPRARIAPRVASSFRCAGTGALRTSSNRAMASVVLPAARSPSAARMQPSATADWRAPLARGSAAFSAEIAGSVPTCPRATAAAEATSGSRSPRRWVRIWRAPASLRTPIVLSVPTRRLPESVAAAARRAASASGPGIASRPMRAQEWSRSLSRSLASSGTASAEP